MLETQEPPIATGIEFQWPKSSFRVDWLAALSFAPTYCRMRVEGGDSPSLLRWKSPDAFVLGTPRRQILIEECDEMAEGTIKRLTDKGFGFISTGGDKDMFFHSSSCEGVSFEELHEGQRVSFTEGHGPKGPRAENVKPV